VLYSYRYDPLEVDRKAYQAAKKAGRLEDYWASRQELYQKMTGMRFERPPGVPPPAPT
jgi:hypothetical protein